MEYALPLAGVALAHLLAAISPGPSFMLVSRVAVAGSRRQGLVAALAMGVGAATWAAAALLGLAVVFARFEVVYAALRVAGGLYLVVLAVLLWRGAGKDTRPPDAGALPDGPGLGRVFRQALLTQLANPKVAVFFGGIFVTLLPQGWPGWVAAAAIAIVLLDETLWYAVVATAFSTAGPRRVYQRVRPTLDRVLAGVLAGLGAKLILDRA
ncbi:MAG: LysE family translocator [Alphaproteobacteria bacterium]